MSPLLMALLGVILLPLFVSTWRASLYGLGAQGLLMAWIAYRLGPPASASDWVTLVDLGLVRGLAVPLALRAVLVAQNAPARNDVIPANLLSWTVALGLVLVAFNAAEILVPEHGSARTLVAVSASGVLLGFLVLATRSGPFSQMIGALRLENAVALLELGGERHHRVLGLQLGQLSLFIATVTLFCWYLGALRHAPGEAEAPSSEPSPRGPSL